MRKSIFTTTILASIALTTGAASAQSIHTGGTAGAYFNDFGPAVQAVIGANPSREVRDANILPGGSPLFFEHGLENSAGTVANIAAVRANPLDLGLGQLDLVAQDSEGFRVINTGASECLFVVSNNEAITSATNLSPRLPFGLPAQGSGSAATFQALSPFSEMRNVQHFDSAMAAVEAVKSGDVVAAGFVQMPDTTNALFEAAKDLHYAGVVNRQMLRMQVDDVNVYEGTPDVTVSPGSALQMIGLGSSAKSVTTSCTPVVIFGTDPTLLEGNDRLDQEELMTTLEAAASAGLLIPDTGDWRSLFASLAERREQAQDRVMQFVDEQMN